MLTPRDMPELATRKYLLFLGGTENFDLWARRYDNDVYKLRIHRVAGGSYNWDVFMLPLRENKEADSFAPPLERVVTGYWGDVNLTRSDVEQIETYLKLFAPWAVEESYAQT